MSTPLRSTPLQTTKPSPSPPSRELSDLRDLREYTGKREFLSYVISLNSNRSYSMMDSESRIWFSDFIEEVFDKDLVEYFVYRNWINGERRPYIARKDTDPALLPKTGDILFLESTINYEVGQLQNRLHAHVYIQICAKKRMNMTIDFFHNLVRLKYEERFGQKCNLNMRRGRDKSLGLKLYAMKKINSDQLPDSIKVFTP